MGYSPQGLESQTWLSMHACMQLGLRVGTLRKFAKLVNSRGGIGLQVGLIPSPHAYPLSSCCLRISGDGPGTFPGW